MKVCIMLKLPNHWSYIQIYVNEPKLLKILSTLWIRLVELQNYANEVGELDGINHSDLYLQWFLMSDETISYLLHGKILEE